MTTTDPMSDTHWLEVQDQRVQELESAMREIAGDYGCHLREPDDASQPPREREACRDEFPDDRSRWCVACIASDALAAGGVTS